MKTFREIQIFVDENNPAAVAFKEALELEFKKREALVIPYPNKENIELVIALGGDGTMFKAVHAFDFGPTFLGVNLGHRGYLMNRGDASEVADRILDGRFKILKSPLLEANLVGQGKYLAMNDVYIKPNDTGGSCKVRVKIGGIEISDMLMGDVFLVCSALGSTGYFVPAGGSAIHPKLSAIGFGVGICSFPPRLTMVIPRSSKVEMTVLSPPDKVKGWCDGEHELPHFRDLQKIIVKSAHRQVKLAFWEDEKFIKRLIRRITTFPEVRHADY